jgi:hypothetical protein
MSRFGEFETRVSQIMRATSCGRREAAALIRQEDPQLYSEAVGDGGWDENSPRKGPKPKRKTGPTEDDEEMDDDADADDDEDDEDDDDDDRRRRSKGKGAKAIAAEFNAAVARNVARGMSNAKAVKAVDTELRQAYVTASNQRAQSPRQRVNAGDRGELAKLQAKWDAAVQAEMSGGLPRAKAAKAAARKYPGLRQSLCEAASAAGRMRA